MIGDHHAGAEEAGQHLTPRRPGLHVLIDDRGISCEVDRRLVDGLDAEFAEARVVAVELQSELRVPIQIADFARFQVHGVRGIAGDGRDAHVDIEFARDGAIGLHRNLFQHEPPRFGPDRRRGGLCAAECDSDAIAALRQCDGEEEWLIAGAGFRIGLRKCLEIEAGCSGRVDGARGQRSCARAGFSADEGLRRRGEGGGEEDGKNELLHECRQCACAGSGGIVCVDVGSTGLNWRARSGVDSTSVADESAFATSTPKT